MKCLRQGNGALCPWNEGGTNYTYTGTGTYTITPDCVARATYGTLHCGARFPKQRREFSRLDRCSIAAFDVSIRLPFAL